MASGEPKQESTGDIAEVIESLGAGQAPEANLRRLFDHYYLILLRFFRRRGFGEDACQDLVQEVFLGVHRNLGDNRGEASFETWLYALARKTSAKKLRRQAAKKRSGMELQLTAHTKVLTRLHRRPGRRWRIPIPWLGGAVKPPPKRTVEQAHRADLADLGGGSDVDVSVPSLSICVG